MSGPKCSNYETSEEQKRKERERLKKEEEERERKRIEEEKRKKEEQRIATAKRLAEEISSLEVEADGLSAEIDKYAAVGETKPQSAVDALAAISKARSKASLARPKIKCDKNSNTVLLDARNELKEGVDVLKNALELMQESFEETNRERINSGFAVSFDNIGERNTSAEKREDASSEKEALAEMRRDLNEELDSLENMDLSDELIQKITSIKRRGEQVSSLEQMKTFLAISVQPLEKECREYASLVKEIGDTFNRLRAKYEFLAKEVGVAPKTFTLSRGAVKTLSAEVDKLEKAVLAKREQEYIERSVNEAMEEMNYRTVGSRSVEKRNGDKYRSVLYSFSRGTVVNVTYSSDGSITMEIGGVSSEERAPSPEEQAHLVQEMKDFCAQHKEIQEELQKKGLVLTAHKYLEEDIKYAKLIDKSKYDMVESVEEYSEVIREQHQNTKSKTRHVEEV